MNPLVMLKRYWMRFASSQKKRRLQLKTIEITDSVNVTVANGSLYITCEGTIVSKVENDKTIDYVLMEMDNIIQARLSYENIGN